MDANYMAARSTRSARIAAQLGGLAQGQIVEALREQRYRWVLAWADHLGFRLAVASKLLRRHVKLIIVSVRLATSKKRFLLGPLALHTHIDSIVSYGSAQRDHAVILGVPPDKLRVLYQPVDERSGSLRRGASPIWCAQSAGRPVTMKRWLPQSTAFPARLEIAVGSSILGDTRGRTGSFIPTGSGSVTVHRQLSYSALRDLYARARVVVVPLGDVDYDAGVTAITEALAMAKPVIVTQTRGQLT